jgi:dihydroorotate dehydrogenase (NAD+) catalytic subunit
MARLRWEVIDDGADTVTTMDLGDPNDLGDPPAVNDPIDMSVDLAGMSLPNPLMTASGCAANGRELHRFFDIAELGAFVTKTVLADPRSGRGTPRMAETPSGMLNSIGLQGPGIADFARGDLVWLRSVGARVVVSIAGNTAGEFADVAAVLRESPAFDAVVGVEVNISCPNVANRGLVFACDPLSSARVIALVREELPRSTPVFAKLSPDVTDIVEIARACVKAGADGLTMINTLLAMVIDTDLLRPQVAGVTGGLSGPAIRPVAVRAIWQVRAAMIEGRMPAVPIIGVGGVRTGDDALQLVAAGASAIQVGTATFNDPAAPIRVASELAAALQDKGFARFSDAVGIAHTRLEQSR